MGFERTVSLPKVFFSGSHCILGGVHSCIEMGLLFVVFMTQVMFNSVEHSNLMFMLLCLNNFVIFLVLCTYFGSILIRISVGGIGSWVIFVIVFALFPG
jgi:hypothetical protein